MIPIAITLLIVGWAISLFVIGLVLRFGTGAEALAWGVMFVLLPLSGVFYPIDALPTVLQPIALALPTTHAFAALRALVDGTGLDWAQVGDRRGRLGRDAAARVLVPRRACSSCSASAATSPATRDRDTQEAPGSGAGGLARVSDWVASGGDGSRRAPLALVAVLVVGDQAHREHRDAGDDVERREAGVAVVEVRARTARRCSSAAAR